MISNFLTVAQQVAILFILIGVGFVCGKTKFLSDTAVTGMTDFVLYIVTPCVLINAFQREFNLSLAGSFAQVFLFTVVTTLLSWGLATLTLHDADKKRESVYRYAAIFSNSGFMGLPLEAALLGADGVFYGAATLAAFNIFSWTVGLYMMSHNKKLLSVKKLITNPGILGVVIGLALFFSSTTLPTIIAEPIEYLSALNTPIPMVVIGYHLSHADLRAIFRDLRAWLTIAERLIIIPLIGLAIGLLVPMDATAFVSCIIPLSAPAAAATTMFAVIYGQDSKLSVGIVSTSTLLSIITMPLMIVLAQMIVA
jgi:hypothetical protein